NVPQRTKIGAKRAIERARVQHPNRSISGVVFAKSNSEVEFPLEPTAQMCAPLSAARPQKALSPGTDLALDHFFPFQWVRVAPSPTTTGSSYATVQRSLGDLAAIANSCPRDGEGFSCQRLPFQRYKIGSRMVFPY